MPAGIVAAHQKALVNFSIQGVQKWCKDRRIFHSIAISSLSTGEATSIDMPAIGLCGVNNQ
jgi:hypothetical protein